MSALTSNRFWLGIDLGQETFDASLAPISSTLTGWRKLPCQSFSTQQDGLKQFLNWLTEQLPPMAELAGVCLESTGGYSRRFAEQLLALAPQLPQVSIINPAQSAIAFRRISNSPTLAGLRPQSGAARQNRPHRRRPPFRRLGRICDSPCKCRKATRRCPRRNGNCAN